MKEVRLKISYILHRMGFHNKNCRRRVYTTELDYICTITGNIHKKFKL
jgi:hypothetical protein